MLSPSFRGGRASPRSRQRSSEPQGILLRGGKTSSSSSSREGGAFLPALSAAERRVFAKSTTASKSSSERSWRIFKKEMNFAKSEILVGTVGSSFLRSPYSPQTFGGSSALLVRI